MQFHTSIGAKYYITDLIQLSINVKITKFTQMKKY